MRIKNLVNVIFGTAILLFACPTILLAGVILHAEHQIVSSQATDLGMETLIRMYILNEGSESLTAVTLEVVNPPLIDSSDEPVRLSISELPVNEEVVVDWTLLSHGRVWEGQPLVFHGTGINASGATVNFPMLSRP